MKRNASGKNGKNEKSLKYDINEILERRGITKRNKTKDLKETLKSNVNLNGNFVFNSSNISNTNRNRSKNNIMYK